VIKVRRRPGPDDLRQGYQFGDARPTVWYVPSRDAFYRMTGNHPLDARVLGQVMDAICVTDFYPVFGGRIVPMSLEILEFELAGEYLARFDPLPRHGWNVIEGESES
jgi:hypothetical protein